MESSSRKIYVYSDGSISYQASAPIYFRVLHEWERTESEFRTAVPEVYPLEETGIELGEKEQRYWFDLFRKGAPSLPLNLAKTRWSSVLHYKKAFSNRTGFGDPENPRANYITGENLNCPNPSMDKHRLCGGMTVKGTHIEQNYKWWNLATKKFEVSDVLWLETLNPDNLPPLDLLPKHLYYHATICYRTRTGMFPNGVQADLGIYEPTYVPFFGRKPVFYPMKWLEPVWDIADPYAMPLMKFQLIPIVRSIFKSLISN